MTEKAASQSASVRRGLDALLPALESIYKDIHSHPELSMQEVRTSRLAADQLRSAGYEVTAGLGKTGSVDLEAVEMRSAIACIR